MTKHDLEQTLKMIGMLQYIGCRDISKVFEKIHFWDFPVSLSDGFHQYGSLTDRQEVALKSLIEKHTGVECIPCDKLIIEHTKQYEQDNPSPKVVDEYEKVKHTFKDLQTIQLFDLPFQTGEEKTLLFYPYNRHSLVVQTGGAWFKIPNPEKFEEISEPTVITFTYKRTNMKGFLTKL